MPLVKGDIISGSFWEFPSQVVNATYSVFEDLYTTDGVVSTANLFKKPGDKIKCIFSGYIYAASGTSQEINLIFDTETVVFSGTIDSIGNQINWRLECTIMASNYTESLVSESILTTVDYITGISSTKMYVSNWTSIGFTNDLILRVNVKTDGVGADASDIIGRLGYIEYSSGKI